MLKKKIGVILSGCGYLDGAEIQEAVFTLYHLDRLGAEAVCFAPARKQHHIVNHLTGSEVVGERNVREEAARIARGKVAGISEATVEGLDGLIFPGGFGAAKNLSTFAFEGAGMSVDSGVQSLILGMREAGKPLGFICISPMIGAKVLGAEGVTLTIGVDTMTAQVMEALGAKHVPCAVEDIVIDRDKRVVSTPAYMYEASPAAVCEGIGKLVDQVIYWTNEA